MAAATAGPARQAKLAGVEADDAAQQAPPAEDDAAEPLTSANAAARAALEQWKADNPWWRTAKNKDLQQEFWDLRRRVRNSKRTLRKQVNKQQKRKAETQDPEELSPEEAAQRRAEETAARQQRVAVHLAQQARVELALREGTRLVVECSFIVDCSAREMRSLGKQLQQCVAVNKRTARPANLTLTSFKGPIREFCERMGGEKWAVNRHEEATLDQFSVASIVLLSPDAKQPLEAPLDPVKVYVVGGLVDRSPRKGITAKFAEQHGIEVRRLPIAEQQLKTADGAPVRDKNFILNVNDVVAALLAVHGGASWAEALDAAVPMRKRLPVMGGGASNGGATNGAAMDSDDGAADEDAADGDEGAADAAAAGLATSSPANASGGGAAVGGAEQRMQPSAVNEEAAVAAGAQQDGLQRQAVSS